MRQLTVFATVFALMVLALPASAGDVCVHVNGELKVDSEGGTSTCHSEGSNSVGVAVNGSFAHAAEGEDNKAIGVNGSHADARLGDNNFALAINDSQSHAREGCDNTAKAINDSFANAWRGDDGTSTAINDSLSGANGNDANAFAVNSSEDFDDGPEDGCVPPLP